MYREGLFVRGEKDNRRRMHATGDAGKARTYQAFYVCGTDVWRRHGILCGGKGCGRDADKDTGVGR